MDARGSIWKILINTPARHHGPQSLSDSISSDVIGALHALQSAEAQFRGRMRKRLHLGANELLAVQLISRLQRQGLEVRPDDVTAALGVTSAATSIILTRLVDRRFVTRHSNPSDGRRQYLRLTDELNTAMANAIGKSQVSVLGKLGGLTAAESRLVMMLLGSVTDSYDAGARPGAPMTPPL
jgi:DNA-binding MarR family transcriptional regulator